MEHVDVAVVGAGAAGIFAALASRGCLGPGGAWNAPAAHAPSVLLLDGQERPGKKILISGGGRCNVTNASVTERDYTTASPRIVRSILAEFPVAAVRALFESRGVELREEPLGKLFPVRGRARAVLDGLLEAVDEAGVERAFGREITAVAAEADGWRLGDELHARRVVIATGGLSVPETGSRGFGYDVAQSVGHDLVPRVPALAALAGDTPESLAGVTLPAILRVEDADGRVLASAAGSTLFTHRGVSGPAALDVSGAVETCVRDGAPFRVRADLWSLADPRGAFAAYLDEPKLPGACLADPPRAAERSAVDSLLVEEARRHGGRALGAVLVRRLPRRLIETLVPEADTRLSELSKTARRRVADTLTGYDLNVSASEGYRKAEVTAGGVALAELRRRTLESRLAPGLHFCGEVCDVTGRLGGFNFQWAWSSGYVAGRGTLGAA